MQRKILSLILLSLIPLYSSGQKTYHQQLYWLRYQNQFIISPEWYWNNEIDNRRFIDPDVQNQLIIHSRLHYKTGSWDLAGGLTYSFAFAAVPEDGYRNSVAEIRPVLEASHELRFGKLFLQNRLRIDNRFFENDESKNVFTSSRHLARARYRFQIRFPLKQNEEGTTTIGMRIADEVMVNSEENFYDQNRIYVTSEFYVNKSLSLEAGYLYIHQQRFGRDDIFSRHVYRFSILHKVFRN